MSNFDNCLSTKPEMYVVYSGNFQTIF